jgi:hypothetical protein
MSLRDPIRVVSLRSYPTAPRFRLELVLRERIPMMDVPFFLCITGQATRADRSAYFADVTISRMYRFRRFTKNRIHHAEDAVFEELKDRIRNRVGE